jgi:hypothetical protein
LIEIKDKFGDLVRLRHTLATGGLPVKTMTIVASISAILLAPPSAEAQPYGLSDLPPNARPSDLSVYLEASAVGTMLHACVGTDVIGVFAWYLRGSQATLFDAQKNRAGKSQISYNGIPIPRVEAIWEDIKGGKVLATPNKLNHGILPANREIGWERFDVKSHKGAGRITEAKSIIRIAAWRTRPYAQPCDRSRAGTEVSTAFTATDLFMK